MAGKTILHPFFEMAQKNSRGAGASSGTTHHHRSSINGRFVTESYAKKHPKTTEKQRRK